MKRQQENRTEGSVTDGTEKDTQTVTEHKKFKSSHSSSTQRAPGDNRKNYDDDDRHEGSFPLEDVKNMEEYTRRITQPPATKRKYALALAYCGSNYSGLQVNPGAVTIEAILERSLLFCGGIKECNYGHLQKLSWTRAARTDKGVHAVGQCCSMKLEFPEDEANGNELFLEQLNSFLPADIRALAVSRTTKSFNARTHCSHRRYEYLLPAYLLTPEDTVTHLFKSCASNSERYPQLVNFRMTDDLLTRFREVLQLYLGTHYFHNFTSDKSKTSIVEPGKKAKIDPTLMRYMMEITAEPCEVASSSQQDAGVEWLKVTILGQSFLLNQIRKMIGLAVEMTRSSWTMEQITQLYMACFQPERKVPGIPMVPGLGLYLDELFFEKYNLKLKYDEEKKEKSLLKKQHQASSSSSNPTPTEEEKEDTSISTVSKLEWSADPAVAKRCQDFKNGILYPHIADQERTSLEFVSYLDYLITSSSPTRYLSFLPSPSSSSSTPASSTS